MLSNKNKETYFVILIDNLNYDFIFILRNLFLLFPNTEFPVLK